jgi:hypothetical protein
VHSEYLHPEEVPWPPEVAAEGEGEHPHPHPAVRVKAAEEVVAEEEVLLLLLVREEEEEGQELHEQEEEEEVVVVVPQRARQAKGPFPSKAAGAVSSRSDAVRLQGRRERVAPEAGLVSKKKLVVRAVEAVSTVDCCCCRKLLPLLLLAEAVAVVVEQWGALYRQWDHRCLGQSCG